MPSLISADQFLEKVLCRNKSSLQLRVDKGLLVGEGCLSSLSRRLGD
jgi:hypothetical protein